MAGLTTIAALQGSQALTSAYSQSQATKAEAGYTATMTEANKRLSEIQAEDAIRRGSKQADEAKKQTKQLIGSQRAALAGAGVAVDEGTAVDLQTETAEIGAQASIDIQNNAWREAWGYKVDANQQAGKAAFTRMAGENNSRNYILTGGLQAINYGANAYYQGQKSTTKKTG